MQNTYNFYNLEASFKEYLLAGNKKPVSVRNYLSDFRHFAGWITFHLQSHAIDNQNIGTLLCNQFIQNYKDYLRENKVPAKTINRRLSTIRKLCSFCISQGWLKENPAKQIVNISSVSNAGDLFEGFRKDLSKKNNESETNSILSDVKEFFSIINS